MISKNYSLETAQADGGKIDGTIFAMLSIANCIRKKRTDALA
ncbi:MAG: hypothetical protein AAGA76_02115 [Pseudomonadota bacterium]